MSIKADEVLEKLELLERIKALAEAGLVPQDKANDCMHKVVDDIEKDCSS